MRLVLTTCPVDKSKNLIEQIVKSKLAACGLEVCLTESKFWWKGNIDEEKETLIIFKTTNDLVKKLFKKIKKLHPYEVPFIGEIEVKKVNDEYIEWLKKVTK
jgi:periplasmic divalent cation tolerance protein